MADESPAILENWEMEELVKYENYIPCFLTSSYLYYLHPEQRPICEDTLFDWVCKQILEKWDTIEHHHKHLISKDDLECGSGFALKEHDYPLIVKSVALSMSNGRFTTSHGHTPTKK